jgi:hypothetical protein
VKKKETDGLIEKKREVTKQKRYWMILTAKGTQVIPFGAII